MAELLRILHRCAGIVSRHAKTLSQPQHLAFAHQRPPPPTSTRQHDVASLSPKLRAFVEEQASLCRPDAVHVCDGSEAEQTRLLQELEAAGTLRRLPKYRNCWLARTAPADVARVESRTFVVTPRRRDAVPEVAAPGALGNWMSPADMGAAVRGRFPGCMRGRTMYVVPFSMGPVASPLAKVGVQVTDSPYVVVSMRVMTRMGGEVLDLLRRDDADFVRCLHSVGGGGGAFSQWPCDPDRTIIMQRPDTNEIVSFGSGYGGNSLLGKKCLALRIGSTIARREGWLAEHMLIVGVTPPSGRKRYLAAAFPSACGKTNLAMLRPALEGYKVECVGDDIAWMRFDASGQLRAINPENGFFGVAPGTSHATNPNAMATIFSNTIFTNVASTDDGGVYWEGLERELAPGAAVTDWLGRPWTPGCGRAAAHPNSRFCAPARQCPVMDPAWEDPEGVPIDAIVFGGRRPAGVPLVLEARSWRHGVLVGAALRSEATAAAEHKGKVVMHDPFAMRPFLGYNFGDYLQHWLDMERRPGVRLPKIFHVNWFRKADEGRGTFLWPGFGENARVLDWILRRLEGDDVATDSAVGLLPSRDALDLRGLAAPVDVQQLFSLPRDFWLQEVADIDKYFREQVGQDLPPAIAEELRDLKDRVSRLP